MKIKFLIGLLILIIFISGCTEKECKTNENCLTKDCFTVECKDNNCVYSIISDCCGNEICEVGETYPECAADCPNCNDDNDCTIDSYDYHKQECVNTPILDVICCGNDRCETNETYSNCARDCPNCDDNNKCTKDSYDYHKQECVNELIIPCCGNEICDEDAETTSNCPTDCPNCDDSNKLTTDSFNYKTQKCENPVTHYFIDDFEDGNADGWRIEQGWEIHNDNGNYVLKGTGHNWAELKEKEWADYIFRVRFKIIKKAAHFNYRKGGPSRYFIGVENDNLNLKKQINKSFYDLADKRVTLDGGWHIMEIRGRNNILNIYIDDELLIKYKDTEDPILSGEVAFETLDNSEFLFDDIEIKVISEEDIIYP